MSAPLILRYSLMACTAYFLAMTTAHFFSIKLPVLFIYFDTPFYAYQDKIISFCAFVYAIFAYGAVKEVAMRPYFLGAMLTTVIGLSLVNLSGDLATVLDGQGTIAYWLQTMMLAALTGWLFFFHRKASA